MLEAIPIRVECHSGYKAEERPKALYWGQRRFEVQEILDRWYQGSADPRLPAADYFKVRTAEGRRCILKHERESHAWFLVSELGMNV